jgi:hypothetical protein
MSSYRVSSSFASSQPWPLMCTLAAVVVIANSDRCQFPDFLQSLDGVDKVERKWMSHVINEDVTAGTSGCSCHVHFRGGHWRQVSPSRRRCGTVPDAVLKGLSSYRRECILPVQRNRYVVSHYDVISSADDDDAIDIETTNDVHDDDNGKSFDVGGSSNFKGYICVEFVRRGPSVVQIRSSSTYRWLPGSSVCDDDAVLVLDDWPLIDGGSTFFDTKTPSPACRLPVGGFSIRMYDKARRMPICDALDGETRVEFGCSSDDLTNPDDDYTIDFRFRHASCVPPGFGMVVQQRVHCVASWTDHSTIGSNEVTAARYTFAVLRHNRDRRTWCFRYPTSAVTSPPKESAAHRRHGGSSFTGYLFRDLLCDSGGLTSLKTDRYLRIDFIPDSPIYDRQLERRVLLSSLTSLSELPRNDDDGSSSSSSSNYDAAAVFAVDGRFLCRDDYEACHLWSDRPCGQLAGPENLSCPRRCHVCSDDRPGACSLPAELLGRWRATRDSTVRQRTNGGGYFGVGSGQTLTIGHRFLQVFPRSGKSACSKLSLISDRYKIRIAV